MACLVPVVHFPLGSQHSGFTPIEFGDRFKRLARDVRRNRHNLLRGREAISRKGTAADSRAPQAPARPFRVDGTDLGA